jgi:nitric oxide reductase subunit B
VKYESQRVAWWFFATCMLLFTLQIVYGFIMAFAHAGYDGLHAVIPFNAARATHTNLLVMWLLCGFMGAAYYIIPEESGRELHSVPLAKLQLGALVVTGVTAIIGFHFNWWEGRKFLEIPRPLDFLVVIDVLAFIFNIGMTVWRGRRFTTTSMVLFFGLLAAALLYLPGMIPTVNQTHDSYWRWWVVHLWVEGVWELIMGAILSYLLIKLTGIDREVIEKWLYVIVGFTFLSGILGTGHHYYFIGTPRYWLMDRRLFSALEPLAFLGMAIYGVAMARKGGRNHPNRTALQWTVGCAVMSFVGAGFLGFAHTLPQVNLYTHGTLVTAMHGHMAFWGAYAMIVLAIITYALPNLTGPAPLRRPLGRPRLLDLQHRHDRDDPRLRRRRHHPGVPGAPRGHGLHRGPEGDRGPLHRAHPRRLPLHRRHRRLPLELHPLRPPRRRGRGAADVDPEASRDGAKGDRVSPLGGPLTPYYRPVRHEVEVFRHAYAPAAPRAAQGPDGLRQIALRRGTWPRSSGARWSPSPATTRPPPPTSSAAGSSAAPRPSGRTGRSPAPCAPARSSTSTRWPRRARTSSWSSTR